MPTKRTPKRYNAKTPVRITTEIVNVYIEIVEMFCTIERDALLSDDRFNKLGTRLNQEFPHIETMIETTFGRREPPPWEIRPDDWRAAHAIRLQLDEAANIDWVR